jgi:penicillin-binding protein 1C
MRKGLKLRNKLALLIPIAFLLVLIGPVDLGLNKNVLDEHKDSSRVYLSRKGRLLRLTTNTKDFYQVWFEQEHFPETLKKAILELEDRHFYLHPGVNPFSIINAVGEKLFLGKRLRGASTITMQLARIMYRLKTRSVLGKLKQMLLAFYLEVSLSKEEILQAFLNLAPMGRNIHGFGTASLIYFDRPLGQLSTQELLLLTSLPQNPARMGFRKSFIAPKYHQDRAALLFENLYNKKSPYSFGDIEMRSIEELPFRAPHLVDQLEAQADSHQTIFNTSLDLNVQQKFNGIIKRYTTARKKDGVNNAVVMLLDWVENEVIAYHGSADFFNKDISGQVNGTLMLRSPGSTLKPFAYALGMDQGLIYPSLIIHDAPSMYKLPQNFDKKFLGPITVKRALNESRNVPAVVLSSQLTGPTFHQFLKNTGVDDLKQQDFYGHTLVLGSKEMSMQHILKYYAALARNGKFKDYSFLKNQKQTDQGINIFSEESAVLIKSILKDTSRPNFQSSPYQIFKDDVYWKTGTSWGYRDSWTFGIQGRYALGVWVGDFSGSGLDRFVGLRTAAPLFFNLLDSLPRKQRREKTFWHNYAAKIEKVKVCPVSGLRRSKHCPHERTAEIIAGVSPSKVCDNHRPVLISKKTGLRSCLEEKTETQMKVYEFWPSHVQRLYEQIGLFLQGPPAYSKTCQHQDHSKKGIPPKIVYPKKNEKFILSREQNSGMFVFNASAEVGIKKLYWYSKQKFLGSSSPHEPIQVALKAGSHSIRVVDDLGRSNSKMVQVLYK